MVIFSYSYSTEWGLSLRESKLPDWEETTDQPPVQQSDPEDGNPGPETQQEWTSWYSTSKQKESTEDVRMKTEF